MDTVSAFTQPKNMIWYALSIAGVVLGILASIFFKDAIAIPVTVIALSLAALFFVKPTWLFYFLMLFFVFGEIGAGEFFVQISLSNGFGILAIGIIVFYSLSGKRIDDLLKSPRQKYLFLGLMAIFLVEIASAILNSSYRPLTTRLSHVVSLLFVLLIVRDRVTIWRGLYLGMISAGMLSLLTILAGLNLNPIGYRAAVSWGSTPWEAYIPRSIGLPNMQGGLHSIYILAFLPLAILVATSGRTSRMNWQIKMIGAIVAILGVLALLSASYRSGWVGLIVSLFCLAWFYFRFLRISTGARLIILLLIACVLALTLAPFSKSIYTDLHNLVFNIRSQGVEARLIQSEFVFNRMLVPSIHQVLGYGYDDFGSSFMNHVTRQGFNNPELYPWIHNYYLGLLYSSGILGFTLFLTLIYFVMRNLYQQAAFPESYSRTLNSAIFSSLAGILAVLLFTAETSGLHIVWILIAISVLSTWTELQPYRKEERALQ